MSLRDAYVSGNVVKLPGGQFVYRGRIYEKPRGAIVRKAGGSCGVTGPIFGANARQMRAMMATGNVPEPSLRVG